MLRDLEKESIQVTIRVRPLSQKQLFEDNRCCIKPDTGSQRLTLLNGNQSKSFAFDSVVGIEEGQEDIFEKVGLNSTTHCLEGYNCSIFAYGQTGSGKTFTMMGVGQEDPRAFEKRGLVPRTLEHLFYCIDKETEESRTEYLVKCTFLQIYNETIIDLLDKNNSNLQIREDLKKGVYVEGVSEQTISKSDEALELLRRGSKGRHVGSTYYNETSSRSHSVFTLLLQSKFTKNGVVNVKIRRFHFIDLAGSERTRHSNGERLKEGCSINKSLHVLGMVINSLVEATEGKAKHVNYRDSKLTFLLKDALGGNSKTHLIANISPGLMAYPETLSTLNFARRVKLIKLNKALINEDASGNLEALKSEILRLKQQINVLKIHPATSLITKQISDHLSPVSSELERVFLKSDGHLGLEKLLKDYIEESIEKETKFEVELLKKEEKIDKLYQAIKQYSKNEIHFRMILEIYEKRFQRMKELEAKLNSLGESVESEALNIFFEQDKSALNGEVMQLRQLLKQTPFLKSLIKQNNILREESRNPEELASIIGANMKFLSQLKQQLNIGIKEREQLNNIIEHYAMQKSSNDMMSPRKQKELEEELSQKQSQYQDRIEQLGLEVAFLKATSEENEILLKEAVERELELEERIRLLNLRVEEGEKLKEKVVHLESELIIKQEKQEELQNKVGLLTSELISFKEQNNRKVEQIVEEKRKSAAVKLELSDNIQSMLVLKNQYMQKIEGLQRHVKQYEEQQESLSLLLQQSQSTLEIEKQRLEKIIDNKSGQISILESRINALEMENLEYASNADTLKLQLQNQCNTNSKITEEFTLKIDKISKQLESQRIQNKKREEELEVRWMNEKVSNEDEANSKIKELNMKLIEEENKLFEAKISYQKGIQDYKDKTLKDEERIEQLNKVLSEQKRHKQELKTKEAELLCSLKETKEQQKQLEASFISKQNQVKEVTNTLKQTISSLQMKNKQIQSSLTSSAQIAINLKQDLQRKDKQIQRLKDSHSKQLEILKQEAIENKERMLAHEQSMKQIFDDCLKNKDKIITEMKAQQATQLAENQRQSEEAKQQVKEAEEKLKQLELRFQELSLDKDTKQRQVERLLDLLEKQRDQSQLKDEQREIIHNEFIDRKNQEIEQLGSAMEKIQSQLDTEQSILKMKQEQLEQIEQYLDINNNSNSRTLIEEIKHKVFEKDKINANLQRINSELSMQLGQSSLREAKQNQQIIKLEKTVEVLSSKIEEATKLSQQLIKSNNQYQQTLDTHTYTNQRITCILQQKQAKNQELLLEIQKGKQNIEFKNQQIESMKAKISEFKSQIADFMVQASKIEEIHNEQVKNYKHEIVQRDEKIESIKREFEQIQVMLTDTEKEKEQIQKSKVEVFQSNASMVLELQKTEAQLKELSSYRTKYLETDSELKQALSLNYEINKNMAQAESDLNVLRSKNTKLQKQVENLKEQLENQTDEILTLNHEISLLNKRNQDEAITIKGNELVLLKQSKENKELESRLEQFDRQNEELQRVNQQLQHNYQSKIDSLEREKQHLEEQLSKERQVIINKLKAMEEMQLKVAEERYQEVQTVRQQFLNELELEKQNFEKQKIKLSQQCQNTLQNQRLLQNKNNTLQQTNNKLAESNEKLTNDVKALNREILKQEQKSIGLKRLIQNLERQKQQLEKELEEKELSYKRLLSKICKEDQPRKASEDKKTIMKTNQLLQKSRLELLQYKKAVDESAKQVRKLKIEMQTKQEHYLNIHQRAEQYCKSQEIKLAEMRSSYEKLEDEKEALLKEVKQYYNLKDQTEHMRQQLQAFKGYKQKSEKRREDLELTIKSLSDELDRIKRQLDEKPGFNRGQDQKMVFINKLKQENGLIKREKFTLSQEMTRLKRQNQILLNKLAEESEEKLRLKQLQERKTLKESGQREGQRDVGSVQVASKIELQRKQAEIRYLQEGYAELCTILNIKKLSEPKNRGQSTLGLIKNVVEQLTQQVSFLRCALKQRQKEIEGKNMKMEMMNRQYNHYKSKDYKRGTTNDYNPIKNALEETNKLVGDEYNSFENLKNRALELKEQSKLKRDKY